VRYLSGLQYVNRIGKDLVDIIEKKNGVGG
jgi:hypothetical protein